MRKLLALLLTATMLLSLIPLNVSATEETTTITAYVTISMYGEFVKTESGENAVFLPVELSEKSSYNLDDLFKKTHELYCENKDAYHSATGDYGAYITKFWGDESGNFGYQVNSGTESVMGLNHNIKDNDYVDVAIYKNFYPNTEMYTKFDTLKTEIIAGESFAINLSQAGYDENWNTVFSPCEGATITVNGNITELTTDEKGSVSLSFDKAGTYIISAYKNKTLKDQTVPAITAPVCEITVKLPDYVTITHNIAEKYSGYSLLSNENMVWFIADIAVYNEIFPENETLLTKEVKQACLDKIIKEADETSVASALAKYIIALRAMGYDAKNVYNSKSKKIDLVSKLTSLIDSKDASVTNIYTLPYVIIALSQADEYKTEEQISFLIDSVISSKDSWQNNEWGTDAASAIFLAIAPYYNTNDELKNIIDETVQILISQQTETGLIGNAASLGIAITALSALNIDAKTIVLNEQSLIDGLMSQSTDNLDGFEPMENSFSTEQGFRGLLAFQLYSNNFNKTMYDFSNYPMDEAYSTKKTSSGGGSGNKKPAIKETVEKPVEETKEDTVEEITIGLPGKNPDIKILSILSPEKSFDDIKGHKSQKEIEALASRNIINGKNQDIYDPDNTMTRAEFAAIISRALCLPDKDVSVFNDVTNADWFYPYINTAFYYGIIKGISKSEFNPNGNITRQEAAVMLARAAKLCGMNTELDSNTTRDTLAVFTDYKNVESWAIDSMAFCYGNNIISDENIEILPEQKVTRAEVAAMIYNMLDKATLLQEAAN